MEAVSGYEPFKMVTWKGVWDLFKRKFKAAARLSGMGRAIKLAEKLAEGQDLAVLMKEAELLTKEGLAQSSRLQAKLMLCLIDTVGAKQAFLESGEDNDKDGVGVWTRLVRHFEFATKGLRARELHHQWARETLQPGEHPARLVSVQRQMARIGEVLTDNNLIEKFVTVVQEGGGHLYSLVISGYNREMVMGREQSIEQLLELMTIEYRLARHAPGNPEVMVGLSFADHCTHCKKMGHRAEDCWSKFPEKISRRERQRSRNEMRKCFKCGKVGHIKKHCKASNNEEDISASLKDIKSQPTTDCYLPTYLDSTSSCHTVTSLKLLDEGTTQRVNGTVRAVDGTVLTLTHKGKRTIRPRQYMVTLNEVYYADGLKYNLMSVPAMAKLGVKITLGQCEAFIEKNESRIYLRRVDGLWALPREEERLGIASLRIERGGTAGAETWHQRLGHPSDNKLSQMIASRVIPRETAGYTMTNCQTCQLTHLGRCPVRKTAERSGKVTVQVDYMPMGHKGKGWNGEVGAYMFSSRSSKLLKTYPVTNASTIDAAHSLEKYCKFVLPYLGEKVDCIQTDAGRQFNAQHWRSTCTKYGLTCRTCPVDYQAMNGEHRNKINNTHL